MDQQIILGPNNHSTESVTTWAVERIPRELVEELLLHKLLLLTKDRITLITHILIESVSFWPNKIYLENHLDIEINMFISIDEENNMLIGYLCELINFREYKYN